jgi:CO/xanthine dehydrogenase FAD-binding subunit
VHHTVRHDRLVRYHRPSSVDDAVALLAEPHRVAYAGGTTIHHHTTGEPVEVVDLQALGLSSVGYGADAVRIGATTTLQTVADDEQLPAGIRDAARAELPSTLRTLATIGGTIGAADTDSVLLAALLVHDAEVTFADGRVEALAGVLEATAASTDRLPPGLIVSVEIATDGTTATARTGRTPADTPIVAAAARRADDGLRLALCGVADVPVLVAPGDLPSLDPQGDFRGSAEYRHELAGVLTGRVLGELS